MEEKKESKKNLVRNTFRTFKFIYTLSPGLVIGILISSSAVASIGYLQAGSFGAIVNKIQENIQNGQTVLTTDTVWLLALVVVVPFFQSISGVIDNFLSTKARFRVMRELTLEFDSRISKLDIATFLTAEFRDKMQIAWERGVNVFYVFFNNTISNIANIISIVISGVILFAINPLLVVLAIAGSIPGLIVESKYGREVYWIWDMNVQKRRLFWTYENNFRDKERLPEVKLFNLSKFLINKLRTLLLSFDDELEKAEKRKVFSEVVSTMVFASFFGFALYILVKDGIAGIIPIGTMVFAYTTFRGFQASLASFFRVFARQIENNRYVGALWEVMDMSPKIVSKVDAIRISNDLAPVIEFNNVSFRYPNTDKFVLKDLNLKIESGQKIGIVGLNGAGKTTLINILTRIYDPTAGSVTLDGNDLRDIDHEDWLKVIGYMSQNFVLYPGLSVRENIVLGNLEDEIFEENVVKASENATAHDFIEKLPLKYDSIIGVSFKDGVEISKGQSQKLAIAKVFYRNAAVLILDEPTSSIDGLSQELIYKNFEEHTDNKTVIMISHNFSTIKNADKIILVEDGKIIETGTHNELMALGSKYKEMFERQASNYNEEILIN